MLQEYATNMETFDAGVHFGVFFTKEGKLCLFGNNKFGQFGNGTTSKTGHVVTEVTANQTTKRLIPKPCRMFPKPYRMFPKPC
jgi:alpha-tubulin suppressor-like RCC1 family protein